MFRKILIANRGEIAVRIVSACRDLDIESVALYEKADRASLHVRLADEAVPLNADPGYMDQQRILEIASQARAEAIHPGYGFLAERADFIRACEEAGLVFIGPPSSVVADLQCKIGAMAKARAAGFRTPLHSASSFGQHEAAALRAEAERLGYPLLIKSCRGGRGRGARLARSRAELDEAVRWARSQASTVYGDKRVYLEKAILPARQLEVQVLADHQGHLIHLGERDGSIQRGNQTLVEESPSPALNPTQREQLWQIAVAIARLFDYRNAGTVEFLMDEQDRFYFTEIKPRIQIEHPATEMVAMIDLVREQIRLAAGEPLSLSQDEVLLRGWAIHCRINAENPQYRFLPNPGRISRVRLPGGPYVRVDTHIDANAEVSGRYDPILAKITVWGEDRSECLRRMRRALAETVITGVQTTLRVQQQIFDDPTFLHGDYTTEFFDSRLLEVFASELVERDLAAAAAIEYARRNLRFQPTMPERLTSGWHRSSRRLPE